MTSPGPESMRLERSSSRRILWTAAILSAGLLLAACGRKGAPEYDTGEPVVKSHTNALVPGLDLPQKQDSAKPKVPPKGNFVLDPLL